MSVRHEAMDGKVVAQVVMVALCRDATERSAGFKCEWTIHSTRSKRRSAWHPYPFSNSYGSNLTSLLRSQATPESLENRSHWKEEREREEEHLHPASSAPCHRRRARTRTAAVESLENERNGNAERNVITWHDVRWMQRDDERTMHDERTMSAQ